MNTTQISPIAHRGFFIGHWKSHSKMAEAQKEEMKEEQPAPSKEDTKGKKGKDMKQEAMMRDVELTFELANPKGIDRVDRVLNTYKKKGSIETFTINEQEHKISMRTSLAEPDVCKILKTCTKKVDVAKKEDTGAAQTDQPGAS